MNSETYRKKIILQVEVLLAVSIIITGALVFASLYFKANVNHFLVPNILFIGILVAYTYHAEREYLKLLEKEKNEDKSKTT